MSDDRDAPPPLPPPPAIPLDEATADALLRIAEGWEKARAQDKARAGLARRMGLTMVGLAVLAAVGTLVQSHHTSRALRSLSRAAVTAEAAGDSRQLYNSRRVKLDLFELQRARIAHELREVHARALRVEAPTGGAAPAASIVARLRARIGHYERTTALYAREAQGHLDRARSLRAQSEAHLEHGLLLSRRANRLKDAVAWFQGGIAILAIAVVLHNRWLWAWAILAAAIAVAIYVTTLVLVT